VASVGLESFAVAHIVSLNMITAGKLRCVPFFDQFVFRMGAGGPSELETLPLNCFIVSPKCYRQRRIYYAATLAFAAAPTPAPATRRMGAGQRAAATSTPPPSFTCNTSKAHGHRPPRSYASQDVAKHASGRQKEPLLKQQRNSVIIC
jgi:hypothetical protein